MKPLREFMSPKQPQTCRGLWFIFRWGGLWEFITGKTDGWSSTPRPSPRPFSGIKLDKIARIALIWVKLGHFLSDVVSLRPKRGNGGWLEVMERRRRRHNLLTQVSTRSTRFCWTPPTFPQELDCLLEEPDVYVMKKAGERYKRRIEKPSSPSRYNT